MLIFGVKQSVTPKNTTARSNKCKIINNFQISHEDDRNIHLFAPNAQQMMKAKELVELYVAVLLVDYG